MKKYTQPATRIFMILTVICLVMLISGIVIAFFAPEQTGLIVLLLGMGFFLGILFLCVWLASARSYILIDDEKIILPVTRAPRLSLKRNQVRFDEIKHIEVRFQKGDGVISGDANMYKFVLKSGLTFTEIFFPFGKKNESEIIHDLKSKVRFV